MILGPGFCYGHIPKTGGDAVHSWAASLNDQRLKVDSIVGPRKHDPFYTRSKMINSSKLFVISFRRLETWLPSLMHQWMKQPEIRAHYGVENTLDEDFACSKPWADEYLLSMLWWVPCDQLIVLRCEDLLQDTLEFLNQQGFPSKYDQLMKVETKPRIKHQVSFEKTRIKKVNPHWAELERMVYR